VDLIDKAFALAHECGGIEQLKRLVDRLAGMQGRWAGEGGADGS